MLVPAKAFDLRLQANQHSEEFARLGLDYPLNEYRATWKMGGQPLAQRLRDKNHDWADLRKLIPGILNQGVMGYAFTCPDLIGGGEYLSFRDAKAVDEELMVRAAQVHALMPMMQFSAAPWRVPGAANLEIARAAAQLHEQLGPEIFEPEPEGHTRLCAVGGRQSLPCGCADDRRRLVRTPFEGRLVDSGCFSRA
jgi:hypothetical protein